MNEKAKIAKYKLTYLRSVIDYRVCFYTNYFNMPKSSKKLSIMDVQTDRS